MCFCDLFVPPAPPYAEDTLESLFPRGCDTERALLSILDIRGESKNGFLGSESKSHSSKNNSKFMELNVKSREKLGEEEKKLRIPDFWDSGILEVSAAMPR